MSENNNEWLILQYKIPEEIREFLVETFEIIEIRGLLGSYQGISFFVHSRENNHALPHVHAKVGEFQTSIEISDEANILSGNLPKKKQKAARNWVRKNKDKLLTDWNNFAISATSSLFKSNL